MLNARDARTANRLAEMATTPEIAYAPDGTRTADDAGRVWYGVTATRVADGATWPYLLRRDWGSYAGSFTR
jgi:hypothetical protein